MLPITTPLSSERRHCELPHLKCPGCCPVCHPSTLSSFPSVSQAAAPPRRPSKASRRPSSSSSMGVSPSPAAFGQRPNQRSHPQAPPMPTVLTDGTLGAFDRPSGLPPRASPADQLPPWSAFYGEPLPPRLPKRVPHLTLVLPDPLLDLPVPPVTGINGRRHLGQASPVLQFGSARGGP
jgi:hypothetical protein